MSRITERTMPLTIEEMQNIFGQHDKYIRKIEDTLSVEIIDRGGELHIIGTAENVSKAYGIIGELSDLSKSNSDIEEQSVNYAIQLSEDPSQDEGKSKLLQRRFMELMA